MKDDASLTSVELASLDLLITIAQSRGRGLDERLTKTEEQCEAVAELHEAMWESRHGGIEFGEHDREILSQIRELASSLEIAPTLGQLVEMRGEAIRANSRQR